jgi:hypothetical protein
VVLRDLDGAAATREIRRRRHWREVIGVSDLNWISAAKAHHPSIDLSKSRTDFGMEASTRSPHFCWL